MSFRLFAIGLTASFGLAWLSVVVVPFFQLRTPSPVSFKEGIDEKTGLYHPKRAGRVVNGAAVYAENGCYLCHTQVVRPTYAGMDVARPDVAGLSPALHPDGIDSRRESNVFDYLGLDYAMIGKSRVGPDLMNLMARVEARIRTKAKADKDPEKRELTDGQVAGIAREYLYKHLYDARTIPAVADWSSCPPMPFLFEEREITGQRSERALDVPLEDGWEIVPTDRADSLVSYLLSLRHDDAVPASMDYAPPAAAGDSQG
jgi:cytochrome c oxidase cbb3-type subunit 2